MTTVIVAAVSDHQPETPRPRSRRRRARIVALTGVHGAAGAALVRRLEADERTLRLVLIDRHAPALPLRDTVFYRVDLTATLADVALAEILTRERVDTVIHGMSHDVPQRNLEAAHELEVLGTRALFRAVADNVRREGTVGNVVVLGTTMSYGALADNPQYLGEEAPLRGGVGYPFVADSLAIEGEVVALRSGTGLPVAMMRLAATVGDEHTLMARLLAPVAMPAVIGTDPLVQLLHVDDLVEAVRLVVYGRSDGIFNVAGNGVLPLSTIIKLNGQLRAAVPESVLRLGLQGLWVVGSGLVPGAHVAYLRETFVADTTRMVEVLGFQTRYSVGDALARHLGLRRGGMRFAA